MSVRMRRPETVRLELTQGDWLIVKKHLTAGETRAVFARMMRESGDAIDPVRVGLSRIVGYLLDWSFQDADGKPLVIRDQPENVVVSMLNNIDPDAFTEVLKAIDTHDAAMEVER